MSDSIPSLRKKLEIALSEIERLSRSQVVVEKIVYIDNPAHIQTIKSLQDRLAQCQGQ